MTDTSSNNRRIAKNTVLLYIRMLLSIVVSLYTSRVVLQTLGVDDYGIYGVVGGVVAMFSFLNASMSGATSRFITFALGKENKDEVNRTFSTALIIHIGIALAVILLSDTIGLWFLENKLVIPEERMNAARIVYQFSILAMAVQVTQVPYNASIISYEKMDVYAYVELLNVFLKLGIVYLLMIGNFDKLILYAALVLAVNIIIASTYRIYCIRKFDTCKFHWIIDKKLLTPMLSFSGWDLYGNMCYSVRQQGVNMLINMFFGVALNAASSVATSIQGVISSLSANVNQAFRPQIVKNYAQQNYTQMGILMKNAVKYSLLLYFLLAVPVMFELDTIMEIWLGTVPHLAPTFCRIMLCISMFNLINGVLCAAIESTGKMKRISFISGSLYLLSIPIIYVLFIVFPNQPTIAYCVSLCAMITVVFADFCILKVQIPELKLLPIIRGSSLSLFYSLAAAAPLLLIQIFVSDGYFKTITVVCVYVLGLLIITFLFDKQINALVKEKYTYFKLKIFKLKIFKLKIFKQ